MESMLNFVTKFTGVVRRHLDETKECIGKEIVDPNAIRSGICIDRIKFSYGAKFSLLGHNYSEEEIKDIESFDEDVLVCQGNGTRFFVPVGDVAAMGDSVILVESNIKYPEIGNMNRKRNDVFKRFYRTKQDIKKILPKIESPVSRKRKKRIPLNIFH